MILEVPVAGVLVPLLWDVVSNRSHDNYEEKQKHTKKGGLSLTIPLKVHSQWFQDCSLSLLLKGHNTFQKGHYDQFFSTWAFGSI